jgi:DNA-binding protein YbaB
VASPIDPSNLGRLLSETMSALGQFQNQPADVEPPEGEGRAANGMVTVRAAAPGRISAVVFDPRVMRMASEALAEEVAKAVNGALTDLRDKTATVSGQVDFGALGAKLKQIQQDSGRQFTAITDSLVEAQERIARQGGK